MNRQAVAKLLEGRRTRAPGAEHGAERVDITLRGSADGPFVCTKKDWEWTI